MYLLRFDDASEHWNNDNWKRVYELCCENAIKPIVAIIPHNEDEKLLKFDEDHYYAKTIESWINKDGWTPALHGYNHVFVSNNGGMNPINNRSEFAGIELSIQRDKIRNGIKILQKMNIEPQLFVAPAHTFDHNTLIALEQETNIRIISDTIATDIYYEEPFYYIPQQSGNVRQINFPVVTFCYHPNYMSDQSFKTLEMFMRDHNRDFISFHQLKMKQRKLTINDRIIRWLYFSKRKLQTIVKQ